MDGNIYIAEPIVNSVEKFIIIFNLILNIMGDSVNNQGDITPKGGDGSIQLAAGGDLKAVAGVTVSDAGELTAVIFSGDGSQLTNLPSGGGVGSLQQVTGQGNVSSNTIELTNVTTGLVISSNITVTGNVTAGTMLGDGSGIINTVNQVDGTYGAGGSNVAAITVDGGRITTIANTLITRNLQQVTDLGNVSSNTIELTNVTTGLVLSSNLGSTNGIRIYSSAGGTVSIGNTTAMNTQAANGVAIGTNAGQTNQQSGSVAIGNEAGSTTQGTRAVSIGFLAGETTQGEFGVALGSSAGNTSQGDNAIAVGRLAGYSGQGDNSIAIGYNAGRVNQHSNTIVLNAKTDIFNTSNTEALYIKPIRNVSDIESNLLCYTSEGEVIDCQNVINSNLEVTANLVIGGLANISNLEVYGTHTDIADLSGTTLTVDAHNHSYRTANVNTVGNDIDTLTINNFKRSSQMVIYITCTTSGSNVSGKGVLTGAKSCHSNIEMSVNDTVVLAATSDGTTTYASACKFE